MTKQDRGGFKNYMRNSQLEEGSDDEIDDVSVDYSQVFPDFAPGQMARLSVRDMMRESQTTSSSTGETSHDGTSDLTEGKSSSSVSDDNGRNNVWSAMTKRTQTTSESKKETQSDIFSEDYVEQKAASKSISVAFFSRMYEDFRHYLHTAAKYPYILIYTLVVFTVLLTAALFVVESIYKAELNNLRDTARMEALEHGNSIAEILAKALIPLRSLQQAVIHSSYFQHLPHQIKQRPMISGENSKEGVLDYRNVTGLCDDHTLMTEFSVIVQGINKNFGFDEHRIFNYRLAPYGVHCFSEPLVNTHVFNMSVDYMDHMNEDNHNDGHDDHMHRKSMAGMNEHDEMDMNEDKEKVFDTRGDIGWDPIFSEDPLVLETLTDVYREENDLVIMGPDAMHGKEVFVAYLAVNFEGYNYTAFGEPTNAFGFVMHYIDWTQMLYDNNIYKKMSDKGLHFELTQQIHEHMDGSSHDHQVVIATNLDKAELMNHTDVDDHVHEINEALSATVEIATPVGKWTWTMVVALEKDPRSSIVFTRIICVVGCLFFSMLFAVVLVERQLHKLLLYKIMPANIIQKLNKNETVVERYRLVSVFFSDIVGFTSLAGEMSPLQVMRMLNELYSEFDKIVEKHGVYKVETIGDAYMVVGGAPEKIPAPEAAQKVALFALELMEFVKNFRTSNGDRIYIRAGIASGPVVAGVVGKSMPRYCFFGDTVNSASRMESTSQTSRIQCMDLTYRLLQDAPSFLFHLEERVEGGQKGITLKGKGMTHTWWLNGVSGLRVSTECVEKNCEKCGINHEIVPSATSDAIIQSIALSRQDWKRIGMPDNSLVAATGHGQVMIDRVTAILQHRLSIAMEQRGQDSMTSKQKQQLRLYVSEIAFMYKNVKFHNFEHCVHVTTSMHKVIDTIVGSIESGKVGNGSICQELWQNAFTHFVMVFGCLIHDVEHTGQSNQILAAKRHRVSKRYPGPSAERNSIYISLDLLHNRRFNALRKAIFPSTEDRFKFGKCIFWAVLGTDIASPETARNVIRRFDVVHNVRKSIEKKRRLPINEPYDYDPALCPVGPYVNDFQKYNHITKSDIKSHPTELVIDQQELEYCVAVEHLMQLCDVSHLMQGWENFLKFNFRLYKELMDCHRNGTLSNPSSNWAIGQIGFFNNYVIPLATRVEKICGSDVASLQFSTNATANVIRWEREGDLITEIFVAGYESGEAEAIILKRCLENENAEFSA